MISRLSSHRLPHLVAAAAPLLAAVLAAGCGESLRYSPDLHYPLRTDLIVDTAPTEQPWESEMPGRLDETIAEGGKKPGGKTTDPNAIDPKLRAKLHAALDEAFGTPYQPRVGAAQGEDPDLTAPLTQLKVRDANPDAPFHTLATGSKVYRFHCVHCHGLAGDGRGPTGPWVVPHPRDYRLGKFKFVSSAKGKPGRPRRDDLLRTLHQGIDGTSMPSFALLSDEELNSLASYVMHLSIRGEVEKNLLGDLASGKDYNGGEGLAEQVHIQLVGDPSAGTPGIVSDWALAVQAGPITPKGDSYPDFDVVKLPAGDKEQARKAHLSDKEWARQASIRHGYEEFLSKKSGNCIDCHRDFGRQAPFRYDMWGTLVRPANLTAGVYRGGRRPIDIFWRIKRGIDPSGMAFTNIAEDKDVWDLVNFVQALPYPQMLPEDVRYAIYDDPREKRPKTAERVEN